MQAIADDYYKHHKAQRLLKKTEAKKQKEFIKRQKESCKKYKFTGEKVVVPRILSKTKAYNVIETVIYEDYMNNKGVVKSAAN